MLLKFGTTSSLLAPILVVGLSAAPATYAADPDRTDVPGQEQSQPINPAAISDEHLEKFANVNVKAQEIEGKYEAQVDGAKTMGDIERIQRKMHGELIDAIHTEDISVDDYQRVAMAVQQDPVLRKRALEMINAKSKPVDK